jgi:hypothetical protein
MVKEPAALRRSDHDRHDYSLYAGLLGRVCRRVPGHDR